MATYNPNQDADNSINSYAYASAWTMHQALKAAGPDVTRESLMKAAPSMTFDTVPMLLPGITIETGPEDRYPIECQQLLRFEGEKWEFFGEVQCAR